MRVVALLALVACSESEPCMELTNPAVTGRTYSAEMVSFTARLADGGPSDYWGMYLEIENGLAPGTFSIDDTDSACRLCVSVNWYVMGGHTGFHPRATYQGGSGKITITSVDPVAGSLQNVRMPQTFADLEQPLTCVHIASTTFASN